MREFVIIAVGAIVGLACIANCAAQEVDQRITPVVPLLSKYFVAGERMSASKLNALVGRIDRLEGAQLESLSRAEYAQMVPRIVQLERKVKGMQKQITILHAKVRKLGG